MKSILTVIINNIESSREDIFCFISLSKAC